MDQAARVQRLRVHAPPGSIEPVRRRVSHWLAAQTPNRLGLPAEAIVLIKSLRADWSALSPNDPADLLGRRMQSAVRPALGAPLGAGCELVWFANEAELLGCLARDGLHGTLAQRWWWRTWLGPRLSEAGDEAVLRAWIASARAIPAAMSQLEASGDALAWSRQLGETGRLRLLDALMREHPIAASACDWLRQGVGHTAPSAGLPQGDGTQVGDTDSSRPSRHGHGSSPPPRRASPGALATDGAALLRDLCTLLHTRPHEGLDAHQLHEALRAGHNVPSRGRNRPPQFADASERIESTDDAAPGAPAANDGAHRTPGGASAEDRGSRGTAGDRFTHPRLRLLAPDDVTGARSAQRPHTDDTPSALPRHTAGKDAELPVPVDADSVPARKRAIASTPESTERDTLPSGRSGTASAHGGVFFLLNVALGWGLYGDFTRPRHSLLKASPWQFLHAAGIGLLGRRFAADPLASWLRAQTPFVRLRAASVLDAAPHDLLPPAEARWLRAAPPSPSPRANELSCWLPLLRQRLALAVNQVEAEALTTCLSLPARIERRGERVDVRFSLHQLPLAVRLAGLDRDPGWVPASGCDIRFHFEA